MSKRDLAKPDLLSEEPSSLLRHMSRKNWVLDGEFDHALRLAVEVHGWERQRQAALKAARAKARAIKRRRSAGDIQEVV